MDEEEELWIFIIVCLLGLMLLFPIAVSFFGIALRSLLLGI
jgi:hypothetical protein